MFSSKDAGIDEGAIKRTMPYHAPQAIAAHLASAKAQKIAGENPQSLVIGADQMLALGSACFDKPKSRNDARQQLLSLRGKTHHLYSAVACWQGGEMLWEFCGTATLSMREFSDHYLESYLDATKDRHLASVGAYQLEGLGINLFEKVEGDYFTILGLPLVPLLSFLRQRQVLPT